jgi:hypothetical protein
MSKQELRQVLASGGLSLIATPKSKNGERAGQVEKVELGATTAYVETVTKSGSTSD